MNGPEEGAERRDERIENYYQESAWDLAERIVDLEDELAASKRDADFGWQHAEKQAEFVGECMGLFVAQGKEAQRLLRYRLAWLSARRRAARESEYAAEALELKDAEIARLDADRRHLRKSWAAMSACLIKLGRHEDLTEDDVKDIPEAHAAYLYGHASAHRMLRGA